MKKPILILAMVSTLLAAGAPAAAQEDRGFLLLGTDAAYADFAHDSCDVFVGYVWARMLVYSDGQIVRPHSDLEVKLTGACGEHVGVVPTVGDSRAGIERLDSAYVDQIEVTLDGGYTALVDLTWEAEGPVRYEWIREPGTRAFHRTRSAPVTGSVTISLGGSELFTVTGDDEMGDARITRYSELHW